MPRLYLPDYPNALTFQVAQGGSDHQPSGKLPGTFATPTGCYEWLLANVDCGYQMPTININGNFESMQLDGQLVGLGGRAVIINLNGRLDATGGDIALNVQFGAIAQLQGAGHLTSQNWDCIRTANGGWLTLAGTDITLGAAGNAHLFAGLRQGVIQMPMATQITIAGDADWLIYANGGLFDAGGIISFYNARNFRSSTARADSGGQIVGLDGMTFAGDVELVTSQTRCVCDNCGVVQNTGGNKQYFPGSSPPGHDVVVMNGGSYSSD